MTKMICRDKFTGLKYWRHRWSKKIQKYPPFENKNIQVLRELSTCSRCGKEKYVLVNLSGRKYKKNSFRDDLWIDI